MQRTIFFLLCAGICSIYSCKKSTDADEYNSIWKPYSETKWVRSGSAIEGFKPTTGGFTFVAPIADTGTYTYTFIPSIYVVSNMTSASDAMLTFRAAIIDIPDTVRLTAGGYQLHTFGVLSGSVRTKGADSIATALKPFVNNVVAAMPLSVHPDSCSRELRFSVTVAWNQFTGGATVNPLPKQKKIAVEFFDMKMTVNGIDVLSE